MYDCEFGVSPLIPSDSLINPYGFNIEMLSQRIGRPIVDALMFLKAEIGAHRMDVGIIGSHLIGIGGDNSDLDLVVRGINSVRECEQISRTLESYFHQIETNKSIKLANFRELANLNDSEIARRNAFCFESCGMKIDVHYANKNYYFSNEKYLVNRPASCWKREETVIIGTIANAEGCIFYPVRLQLKLLGRSSNISVLTLDPAAHFLRAGDEVTFVGSLMTYLDTSAEKKSHFVARKLIAFNNR